ncbi:MAG: hypothetical protein RID91_16660 [Azospirillaceae bacterium]
MTDFDGGAGAGAERPPTALALVAALARRPFWPVAGALAGRALALCWLVLAPERWAARAVVAPALSGDAVLAGSDPDSPRDPWRLAGPALATMPAFERYLALLESPDLVARLLADPETALLLRRPAEDRAVPGPFGRLLRALGVGGPARTPAAIAEDLARRLEVRRAAGGELHHLRLLAPTPAEAERLLSALHAAADATIREAAARRAAARRDYLEEALARARMEEHRRAIGTLLMRAERVRMTIDGGLPFAAELVHVPRAEPRPAAPVPWLVLAAGVALGVAAGSARVLARPAPDPRSGQRSVGGLIPRRRG